MWDQPALVGQALSHARNRLPTARGSVVLTSNLPFSKWEQIFKDAMTTAAAIDRLVHHSVILELNVPSYRLENAKNPRQKSRSNKADTKPK